MNNNYENLPAVLNANQLAAALGTRYIPMFSFPHRIAVMFPFPIDRGHGILLNATAKIPVLL